MDKYDKILHNFRIRNYKLCRFDILILVISDIFRRKLISLNLKNK